MKQERALHPRNRHSGRYNFEELVKAYAPLKEFVITNDYGSDTIDFFNPLAVKALNKAILALHYGILYWDIPANTLTPPIPGRAEYIHNVADLLAIDSKTTSNKSNKPVRCLDVGVGANCIYPIIGCCEYGWEFVGTDIDADALNNADEIIYRNKSLRDRVTLKHQRNRGSIFRGVVSKSEYFNLSICNPPFHSSERSANQAQLRKLKNLKGRDNKEILLNFGGKSNELWCNGGELRFISLMITESLEYKDNFGWFTTIVSREENIEKLCLQIQRNGAEFKIIDLSLGNKKCRLLAWRY